MKIALLAHDRKKDLMVKLNDDNTISIEGKHYEFDTESVDFPQLAEQVDYAILEAHRISGELHLTVRRFYTGDCTEWDTGDYHVY